MSLRLQKGQVSVLLKKGKLVAIVVVWLLILRGVLATDPYFVPEPPRKFNLTQDVAFYYDLNATDDDGNYPIQYSHNAHSEAVNFSTFYMNPNTGVISFIPRNGDVGAKYVTLIIRDSNHEEETTPVMFNVSNVNDPPEIVLYSPSPLNQTMYENDSVGFSFSYNYTDPDLPYGDIIQNVWILDGENQSKNSSSWNFTSGFCEPSNRNVTLIVWDLNGSSDSITWDITIINVNRPPVFNSSTPILNITWPEDHNLTNNISLDDYFYDPDYSECTDWKDELNFSVAGNVNINIVINSSDPHNVSFSPARDWYGVETVNFTMSDGINSTTSNNVVLNVTEEGDIPVIQNISNQTAYAWASFVLQVNASDPDPFDTLTYYDNTTLFNIHPTTGLINFTPNYVQPGNYSIMINVSDGINNVFTVFHLQIFNNTPPGAYSIPDQAAMEGALFTLVVQGFDMDNDNLTFQTNYSRLGSASQINETAAQFSFIPRQQDVGNHSIRLKTVDEHGAVNYSYFNLNITDISFPPELDTLPSPIIVKVGKLFNLQVNASDPDGDLLNFTHNASTDFPHFAMNSSGSISFTANESDLGNHSVNISVWDIAPVPQDDWQVVLFVVTYNRAPTIEWLGLHNATEDMLFVLQVNGSDPDGDGLSFYANTSFVNMSTSGLISFIPNQTHIGLHNITINATDGDGGWATITFLLNISDMNDAPYFYPALENYSIWNRIFEHTNAEFYVNATDEDGDDLSFNSTFINGSSLFNITKVGRESALISFTPLTSDIGNYSVNISVSDGINTTWVVINFSVQSVNDPPSIAMIYPYGGPVANQTVFAWINRSLIGNATEINGSENMSVFFNHSSYDPDNLSLIYAWYLDGNAVASTEYWNYSLNFSTAGEHNITLVVSDGNSSDRFYWNLTVNNINRAPVYGKKIHDEYSGFGSGNYYTNSSGARVQLSYNGSEYYASGYFNSSVIDMDMNSYFEYTYISWDADLPNNTQMLVQTRTSTDNNTWTAWSAAFNASAISRGSITSTDYRYIQYRLNLSTDDGSATPVVQSVAISYVVANKTWSENQDVIEGGWIDLDDFFYDPDGDALSYSVSYEVYVDVTIQNLTHFVGLYPQSDGIDRVMFTATDVNNASGTSNRIKLTVLEDSGTSPGSSGGSSTSVIIETRIKQQETEVEKIVNLDIVAPDKLTTYKNGTIVSTIKIRNTGEELLSGITLSAESNHSGITFEFVKSFFESLAVDEEQKTSLIIQSPDLTGNFEIIIRADVTDPEFSDTAKMILYTIEKGELNETQLNTKITFTRDLLLANPECLELTELLEEAQAEIANGSLIKANELIENTIRYCRYLLTSKETMKEKPSEIQKLYDKIFLFTPLKRVKSYVIIIVVVFSLLTISLLWERHRKTRAVRKARS
ncbi:MAG: putative Ig domain-containing protein [Candidatus Woesearchaeota archaeon]